MKGKEIEEIERKTKRMDLLNSKINLILPELMSRNIKLVERLTNKLKVSSFFNNVEQRNKKFFQDFIFSSDKRAKDLKTGLKINKAIKQSSVKMSLLCRQMSDDIILKNADSLLKEKKLINENTEQETHLKINEFIQKIKTAVKKPYGSKIKPTKNKIKSMSQEQIKEAKEYITDKIMEEEKQIQDKINNYLIKLHNSLDCNDNKAEEKNDDDNIHNQYTNNNRNNKNNNKVEKDSLYKKNKIKRKKEFNRYVENIYMKDNINFINYIKPKPFQIKDKECATLKRIKKVLDPPSLEELSKKNKNEKDNIGEEENDTMTLQSKTFFNQNNKNKIYKRNLNRNRSMNNIKSDTDSSLNKLKSQTTKNNKSTLDEFYNIDVSGKDTLEVLYDLVDQGKYLSKRMEKKLEKIDSLIDVKLPYPSSYELVLNYFRRTQNFNDKLNKKYFSFYPILSNKQNKRFNDTVQNGNKTLEELTPSMRKKLLLIKDDIKFIKNSPYLVNKLEPMLMTYFGYHTNNFKNGNNKKLTHKSSMDNIMEKRDNTMYVTLKKLVNDKKQIDIERKIKSSNDMQTENKL